MRRGIDVIQLLRGLAAILVCLFHMKGILPDNKLGQTLFGNGSIGVPLFFMISGFIMYHTTRLSKPDLSYIGRYLKKRVVRIAPLYFLCTILSIFILDQWMFYAVEHPERLLSTLFFFPTFHVMLGPSYGMPALAVGWSLNYEMYFYLLLGLAMLFPSRRWLLLCGFILLCVFAMPVLFFGSMSSSLAHAYPFGWKYLNLMCNPVLLFFLCGIFMGMLYNCPYFLKSIPLTNTLLCMATLVFILSYARIWLPFPGFWSYLFSCGFLLFACLLRDRAKPIFLSDALVFPGDVSYSLYLIHPLLITGIPQLSGVFGINFQTTGWLYFGSVFILILLLAHHSYQLVEQRLGKWLLGKES